MTDTPECTGAPEITAEMIAVGLAEMDGFELLDAWESQAARIELISRVYLAMFRSRDKEGRAFDASP